MVPAIGLTVGWRWAFILISLGAVGLAFAMPKDPYRTVLQRPRAFLREGDAPMLPLIVLAGAAFCGAAVGTSLASFFVESAVAGDVGPAAAGLLLVFGSASGIMARLAIGWSADRRTSGHLNVVMLLLSLGAVGFAGLAIRGSVPVLVVSTVLAFAAGWGWPGLFNFAVVRLNPNAPAAATAITQTGVFVGGVIGPAAFGRIVDLASYETAWLIGAAVNVLSACFVLAGRSLLRRAQRRTAAA
jgi:predicted MFS family arabinose efflux permease